LISSRLPGIRECSGRIYRYTKKHYFPKVGFPVYSWRSSGVEKKHGVGAAVIRSDSGEKKKQGAGAREKRWREEGLIV
jgi:hypothetical protein